MDIFDRICRGCNNVQTNFKNIFEHKMLNGTKSICEILRCCSQMEVDIGDKYPKQICTLCERQLEISYKFIIQYRKSIQKFNKTLACSANPICDNDDAHQVELLILDDNYELNLKSIEEHKLVEENGGTKDQKEILVEELDAHCVNYNDLEMTILKDNEKDVNVNMAIVKTDNTIIPQNVEYRMVQEEICISTDIKGTEEKEVVSKKDNNEASGDKDFNRISTEESYKEVVFTNLMIPKMTRDNQIRRFSCFECKMSFHTKSALSLHQKIKHRNNKLKQVEFYSCNKCSQCFENLQSMERHKGICQRNGNYGCNICLKTFPTRVKLSLHLKKHSN